MTRPDPQVPPAVAGLEREVMEEVWAHDGEELTVRQVLDALNGRDERQRAYTTLMTVLSRLHRKRLLDRRRDGRTDLYSAVLPREQYVEARAREEVDALVGTYGDVALAHFARRVAEQDPGSRERLRRLAGRD
ncbi:BlaI/MecI/CopY family transcriptional regulator [Conexibacter woesei]|uniref:Transcriptional repressor, CopY family n=1 Tax=Conexibacter woesei (strain DSM 14684 / CCUG 47730 / CIP 108061 / JCM 11494 / NBRC 100937 / ID131577) TaxID=469383 RepID=D3F7P3_CONWI|nr:BlaI/MecI/CopY family transcriptional regulator [Conexibacter woesei]ADB50905.1 transcriptional repressor, CopY family [Conexibacter woesei DSM 14684]